MSRDNQDEEHISARHGSVLFDDEEDSIDFHDRIKRLWREMTPERFDLELNRALFSRRRNWLLRCDATEQKDEIFYSCEMPGVEKDDISVEVSGRALLINGHRSAPIAADNNAPLYLEQRYGNFHKRLRVPEGVTAESITARLHNGVLDVHVPKPETKEKDKVKVKIG